MDFLYGILVHWISVPPSRGIVGDRLFNVESGIIATWVKNVGSERLTEAFPFRPEMVGQSGPQIVLSKGSSLDSVMIWLDKLGFPPASEEQTMAILREVKATSLKKRKACSAKTTSASFPKESWESEPGAEPHEDESRSDQVPEGKAGGEDLNVLAGLIIY